MKINLTEVISYLNSTYRKGGSNPNGTLNYFIDVNGTFYKVEVSILDTKRVSSINVRGNILATIEVNRRLSNLLADSTNWKIIW